MRKIFSPFVLQSLLVLIAVLSVIIQCWTFVQTSLKTVSMAEALIRYFSFFTVQTNLLVCVCFFVLLFKTPVSWYRFFNNSSVLTAIAVYITIVGLVYNIVLRSLYHPVGIEFYADNGLHVAVPVLTLFYWALYLPDGKLKWKQAFPWLIFPLVYLLYTLLRGAAFNYYPYPFIDVINLGYAQALINAAFVTMAFLLVSFILIFIAGRASRK